MPKSSFLKFENCKLKTIKNNFINFYLLNFVIQKQKKKCWYRKPLSWDFEYLKHIKKLLLIFKGICFSCALKSEVNFLLVYDRIFSVANFLLQISNFTCDYAIGTNNPICKYGKEWFM